MYKLNKNKKIFIIGAGASGLMAAYEILTKTNLKPIVVEQTSQVGGLAKSVVYKDNIIDVGGHRFYTNNQYLLKMWNKILPFANTPNSNVDSCFLLRNKFSRIYYLNHFFDYPLLINYRAIKSLGFTRAVKIGCSYLKAKLFKKHEINLENYYINCFGKYLYKRFFKDYTYKICGVSPDKISSAWGRSRTKGLTLDKASKKDDPSLSGLLLTSFYYPKYGPSQFFDALAKWCVNHGATILKNSEITKINIVDHKINSVLINKKEKYSVDYLFSSIPLDSLINIIKPNIFDEEINKIANNLPYRNFVSVNLLLKDLKIHDEKEINQRIKDTWIYIPQKEFKLGRIQILNNWSPYLVKDHANTTLIGLEYFTDYNDAIWKLSHKEMINYAIEEIEELGFIDRSQIIDSTVNYLEKAYPGYHGSYLYINQLLNSLSKIRNLQLIGRNGRHVYCNLDEAMESSIIENTNFLDFFNLR